MNSLNTTDITFTVDSALTNPSDRLGWFPQPRWSDAGGPLTLAGEITACLTALSDHGARTGQF